MHRAILVTALLALTACVSETETEEPEQTNEMKVQVEEPARQDGKPQWFIDGSHLHASFLGTNLAAK
jgi:hypothetical protein